MVSAGPCVSRRHTFHVLLLGSHVCHCGEMVVCQHHGLLVHVSQSVQLSVYINILFALENQLAAAEVLFPEWV